MKPIRDQESARRDYHADASRSTVHRSSLLAPNLPGSDLEISFANHFFLKRGYTDVACRITAIDEDGQRVASKTYPIREPKVYVFAPASLTREHADNYMVEFFSAENFVYPYPAVMINHRNPRSLNSVHSYNRMLNDVFENDEINSADVAEASIDVRVDASIDTFGVFTSGPTPVTEPVRVELAWPDRTLEAEVLPRTSRLSNTPISIRELFGSEAERSGAVLRFCQPSQDMFYGRMLAGLVHREDAAIAANHSFYDCSGLSEYWPDGRPSSRIYPVLDGFAARIRLYPLFSPGRLHGRVDLRDRDGKIIESVECAVLESPSGHVLDLPLSEATSAAKHAASFSFTVWPAQGRTPRRINHQLIYEDPAGASALAASVAISLKNPNAYRPPGGRGLCWGQCPMGSSLDSRLGIVLDEPDGARETIELRLYSEAGEVYRREHRLTAGSALVFDPAALLPELADRPVRYLWYWVTAIRSDLAAYAVTRHRLSGHCSGEHSF